VPSLPALARRGFFCETQKCSSFLLSRDIICARNAANIHSVSTYYIRTESVKIRSTHARSCDVEPKITRTGTFSPASITPVLLDGDSMQPTTVNSPASQAALGH
jgi:hypothetical protein